MFIRVKCLEVGDYAHTLFCNTSYYLFSIKVNASPGLCCRDTGPVLLLIPADWHMLWAKKELCSSSPPQTWPSLHRTAFRSVKRRANTSFSSCFLALFSCWFSTPNLRDLCKTRLWVLFTRMTPLPTASCVPCPPQSCSVCGVCWWAGCHTQPPSQSWASARFWSLQRFSSHLRSSSIWASLLRAVSCACR